MPDTLYGFAVTTIDWQAVGGQAVPSARTKYVVFVVGDFTTLVPVPSGVPPQLALYHCQLAPVPKLPPVNESVVLTPAQISPLMEALIPVAAVEGIALVKVTSSNASQSPFVRVYRNTETSPAGTVTFTFARLGFEVIEANPLCTLHVPDWPDGIALPLNVNELLLHCA